MDLSFESYYLHVLGRKRSTVTRQVQRVRAWERLLDKPATEIEPDDVLWYLLNNPLGHSCNTRKGMLVGIQQFHRFEAATGKKKLNGICEIRTPSITDEESSRPLHLKFVRPLLEACRRPLEFRLVYLGLYAGFRIGESAYFHGSMWQEGVLWLKGEKTDKVRPIPVHRDLKPAMWDICASRPTDGSTLQRVKRRLEERTGIDFVAHELRKRFTQSLADAGVDKGVRGDLLGHKTVTDIYSTPSLTVLRGAVDLLDY